MADKIEIEVLADGRIVATTDEVSAGNHRNAEEVFALLEQLMGGKSKREKRKQGVAYKHHGIEHRH